MFYFNFLMIQCTECQYILSVLFFLQISFTNVLNYCCVLLIDLKKIKSIANRKMMEKLIFKSIRVILEQQIEVKGDISLRIQTMKQVYNLNDSLDIGYGRIEFDQQIQFSAGNNIQYFKFAIFQELRFTQQNNSKLAQGTIQTSILLQTVMNKHEIKIALMQNYLIRGWLYFQCLTQQKKDLIPSKILFIRELKIKYYKKPWINYKLRLRIDRSKVFTKKIRGNIVTKSFAIGIAICVKNSSFFSAQMIDLDQESIVTTKSRIMTAEILQNENITYKIQLESLKQGVLDKIQFPIKNDGRKIGNMQVSYFIDQRNLERKVVQILKKSYVNLNLQKVWLKNRQSQLLDRVKEQILKQYSQQFIQMKELQILQIIQNIEPFKGIFDTKKSKTDCLKMKYLRTENLSRQSEMKVNNQTIPHLSLQQIESMFD